MWHKAQLLNWIASLLFSLAAVLLLYGILFTVISLPIFPFKELNVHGETHRVNREQVKLIVAKHIHGNFFTLDLIKTRDAFEKLPWVQTVSMRRRLPDTLEVSIKEHKALARWDDIALVNTQGALFDAASDADLPVFYGPNNSVIELTERYEILSKALSKTGMKITKVSLSARRAWEIETDKGILIALGRENIKSRLEKFSNAYQTTLGDLNVDIKYADLRYPNGFAVRKPSKLPIEALKRQGSS